MRRNGAAKLLLAGVSLVAAAPGMTWAQAPTPAQSASNNLLPDIVGFRPGMTAQEAYDKLKAYDTRARVKAGQTRIAQFGDKPLTYTLQMSENGETSAEVIETDLTLPPTKQIVWRIIRRFAFDTGKEMLPENLLASLREKYGHESLAANPSEAIWFFDAQGQPAQEGGGLKFNNCNVLDVANDVDQSIDQYGGLISGNRVAPIVRGTPEQELCRKLIKVEAHWNVGPVGGLYRVQSFVVAVSDFALEAPAHEATSDFIANANSTQQQNTVDRAQQRDQGSKPKL